MSNGIFGDEFDSFWNLASIISEKKKKPKEEPQAHEEIEEKPQEQIVLTEITDDTPPSSRDEGSTLTHSHRLGEKLIHSYTPKGASLIKEVRLYKRENKYSFYSSFREDALRYIEYPSQPAEPVPFFSYIPQYSQMTPSQLGFYFYFRDKANAGEFLPADISYFWLYIYEIINLPDVIEASLGVKRMCQAWGAFRSKNPKIDKYMTVWLADYCLVNGCPCPFEDIAPFLPAILEHAGFKEFYLGHAVEMNAYGVHTLLSLASSYDWMKSKFVLGLSGEDKNHILYALVPVVKSIYNSVSVYGQEERIFTREAYSGSLCGHNIKCRIEAIYHSFSHSPKLTDAITVALKYAENQMRILHKQKSRLTVGESLSEEHKAMIDAYFAPLFGARDQRERKSHAPAYERLYDAEEAEVSLTSALAIENASWENTRRLVEEEQTEEVAVPIEEQAQSSEDTSQNDTSVAFLTMLLSQGTVPADFETVSLCESINDMFLEELGDIVIEIGEDGCTLIEDYREDIITWLKTK